MPGRSACVRPVARAFSFPMRGLCAGALVVLSLALIASPARAGTDPTLETMVLFGGLAVAGTALVLTVEIGNIVHIAHGPSQSGSRRVFSWGGIILGAIG